MDIRIRYVRHCCDMFHLIEISAKNNTQNMLSIMVLRLNFSVMEQNGRPELSKTGKQRICLTKAPACAGPDAADRGFEWTPGLAESIRTGAGEFMRQIRPRFAVISGVRGFNKGFFHGESKKREMGLVEAEDQAHRARGEDKCVI